MSIPVIAIDGPSGSGKGTLAKRIAHYLQFNYLDSGALYRLAALVVIKNRIYLEDNESILHALADSNFTFKYSGRDPDNDSPKNNYNEKLEPGILVLLNDEDVTQAIRQEACSQIASLLATRSSVREFFLEFQRASQQLPGLVAEGRDIGSVIFPNADIKFYLYADVKKRAERRLEQLKQYGRLGDTVDTLLVDMKQRDEQDATRAHAPLVIAEDAIKIDNSDLDVNQTVTKALELIREHTNIKIAV